MRKFLLLPALLISLAASAQFSFGFYGLHNTNTAFREGWGFGFNGLSPSILKSSPVKIQFGLGYTILGAGQRNFRNVVLTDGEPARDVSFSNMQVVTHGLIRISAPSNNGRFVPYTEFTPGVRFNSSTISVTEASKDVNIYSDTPARSSGFNFGVNAGLMFNLTRDIALDAGLCWDQSMNPGKQIAMSTAGVSDGITYSLKQAPSAVTTFRFGIRVTFGTEKRDCCSFEGCKIKRHHTKCGATHLPHR